MFLLRALVAATLLAATTTAMADTVYECDKCKIFIDDSGEVRIRDKDGKIIPGFPDKLYAPVRSVAPLAALPEGFTPPPPPKTQTTINVCNGDEAPDCVKSVRAAFKKHPGGGLRVRVHCGSYKGDVIDLRRRSHVWIEGVPCADGRLPQIAMHGKKGAWVEFSPMGGPEITDLRVENLHITGPGQRKSAIRLNGKGPMVVNNVVIENQQNGVYVTNRASGEVWVLNSRFEMNGHGRAGKQHHIYASCIKPSCRTFVINSRFGGLYSKDGRSCSNQIRFRSREAFVLNSVFDAREGCVSRSLNTSPQNMRLVVRDSIFIQGNTENSQVMMTPMGGDTAGELTLENVVVVSERENVTRLIGVKAKSQISLKDVTVYSKSGCDNDNCVFTGAVDPAQVRLYENVRVLDDPGGLPERVRNML
ncbi:MAG: hypothetical protein RIM84_10070 [Alphaproteobacteria bacterium]